LIEVEPDPSHLGSVRDAYVFAGRLLLDRGPGLSDIKRLRALGLTDQHADILARAKDPSVESSDCYKDLIKAPADPEILLSHVQERMRSLLANAAPPGRRAGTFAWPWSYTARASTIAFGATGDLRFAEEVLSAFEEIAKLRDSEEGTHDTLRGRVLQAWGGTYAAERALRKRYIERGIVTAPITQGTWTCNVVTNGRICYPVAMLCRQMLKRTDLPDSLLDRILRCIKIVRAAVDEFMPEFVPINGDAGYFSRWVEPNLREPLNHQNSFGLTLINLAELTGVSHYREVAEKLARYFKASIRRDSNGAYVWGYRGLDREYSKGHLIEDVGHAHLNVHFAKEAFDEGIVFTSEDMEGFVTTFLTNIYRGNNTFIASLSPAREKMPMKAHHPGHIAGWILLSDIDPRIRDVIERAVAYRADMYPDGWFSGPVTPIAYAYRIKSGA
jgi:hypothetical protein